MSKNTFGGINGFQKNKVGSVVGYKFRGEQVYRGYQKNVANPRTLRQQKARLKFSEDSSIMRMARSAVNKGYMLAASGTRMSPRNMAMRDSHGAFSVSDQLAVTIDYNNLHFSKGNFEGLVVGRGSSEAGTLTVVLNNFIDPTSTASQAVCNNAELYLFVYATAAKRGVVLKASLAGIQWTGQVGQVAFGLPTWTLGVEAQVYAFIYIKGDCVDSSTGDVVAVKGDCGNSQIIFTGELE